MARGWESKSVEDQVAAAEAAQEAQTKPHLTEAERARQTATQSLLLSRAQTMNRLKLATNPRYRTQLESALKHIEDRLRELEDKNDGS